MQSLHEAWQSAVAEQDRLPGWEACFVTDPKIQPWLQTLEERVQNAIRDEDRVRFEKELRSLVKAWNRINELIAGGVSSGTSRSSRLGAALRQVDEVGLHQV